MKKPNITKITKTIIQYGWWSIIGMIILYLPSIVTFILSLILNNKELSIFSTSYFIFWINPFTTGSGVGSIGTSSSAFGAIYTSLIARNSEGTLSDINRKKNISRIITPGIGSTYPEIEEHVTGTNTTFYEAVSLLFEKLNFYTFNYKEEDDGSNLKIGVMAQEIELILADHPTLRDLLIIKFQEPDEFDENGELIRASREVITLRTDNLDTLKTIMIQSLKGSIDNLEIKYDKLTNALIKKGVITHEEIL